jgi:hypothetical protein
VRTTARPYLGARIAPPPPPGAQRRRAGEEPAAPAGALLQARGPSPETSLAKKGDAIGGGGVPPGWEGLHHATGIVRGICQPRDIVAKKGDAIDGGDVPPVWEGLHDAMGIVRGICRDVRGRTHDAMGIVRGICRDVRGRTHAADCAGRWLSRRGRTEAGAVYITILIDSIDI